MHTCRRALCATQTLDRYARRRAGSFGGCNPISSSDGSRAPVAWVGNAQHYQCSPPAVVDPAALQQAAHVVQCWMKPQQPLLTYVDVKGANHQLRRGTAVRCRQLAGCIQVHGNCLGECAARHVVDHSDQARRLNALRTPWSHFTAGVTTVPRKTAGQQPGSKQVVTSAPDALHLPVMPGPRDLLLQRLPLGVRLHAAMRLRHTT